MTYCQLAVKITQKAVKCDVKNCVCPYYLPYKAKKAGECCLVKKLQKVFSRVVINHRFGVLHIPLDGLEGGGVEDFLSFPAVTSVSSGRLAVQNMNPQQETVVHDLKALQDLTRDGS